MDVEHSIIIDFPRPEVWDEDNIFAALSFRDEDDLSGERGFSDEDLRFITRAIIYYRNKHPEEYTTQEFELEDLDGEIDDEGVVIRDWVMVDMIFPAHMEPPASFR